LNLKRVASLKEILNHEVVRDDGYSPHMFEIEMLERKGPMICSRIVQRASLRLNIGEQETFDRKRNISSNLEKTLGKFKSITVAMIMPPAEVRNAQYLRDTEAIERGVADRKDIAMYLTLI
jgi:hypothetical protein